MAVLIAMVMMMPVLIVMVIMVMMAIWDNIGPSRITPRPSWDRIGNISDGHLDI